MTCTNLPTMASGYAYETPADTGNPCRASWRYLPSDAWEIVVCTATGAEQHIGVRIIDGARVNVWSCPDGMYRAQTKLG